MYPILFSIGPFHLASYGVFIVLSWFVFSFLFWRILRDQGIEEEKIFTMMFYATLATFLGARIFFVLTHWSLFDQTPLRIVTLWIQPGLSLIPALIVMVAVSMMYARSYGIRRSLVIDAVAVSFGWAFLMGSIGSLLAGTSMGTVSTLAFPFRVSYVGQEGLRYPVQGIEMIAVFFLLIIIPVILRKVGSSQPHGFFALWFFFFFTISLFCIEFIKEGSVYWGSLTVNQWLLIGIFSQTTGVLIVWGKAGQAVKTGAGRLYAAVSRRLITRNQKIT